MSAKSINVITPVALLITVVVVVSYFISTYKLQSDKVVESQDIECLTAICLSNSKFGDDCYEMPATLKLVTVIERKDGTKRIIIEPSSKKCGLKR
tara:strand:+ start:549 stop:833 length:285 start_codon:yes stop_codon:yes gene_type:complete